MLIEKNTKNWCSQRNGGREGINAMLNKAQMNRRAMLTEMRMWILIEECYRRKININKHNQKRCIKSQADRVIVYHTAVYHCKPQGSNKSCSQMWNNKALIQHVTIQNEWASEAWSGWPSSSSIWILILSHFSWKCVRVVVFPPLPLKARQQFISHKFSSQWNARFCKNK